MIGDIRTQLSAQGMINGVVGNRRRVHWNSIPSVQIQRLSLARRTEKDVGGAEIGLKQLKPGDQALCVRWKQIRDDMFSFVVIAVHFAGQNNLSDVAGTFDRLRAQFRFRQGRQEQSRQYGDNGDHHQQFDQRKGKRPATP